MRKWKKKRFNSMKKLFITILTSGYLSFFQQGKNLAAGFKKLGYKTNTVALKKNKKEEAYKECVGDIIISVSTWRDWPLLCREPTKRKKRVFPWLVSDDKVLGFVDEINKSPVLFTTSNFCRRTFEKAGVKSNLIQVIPEGIDGDFWKPISQEEKNKTMSMLPLIENGKKVVLLTVGGDGTSKGAQEVLKALKKIPFLDFFYIIKIMPSEDGFFEGPKEKRLIKDSPLKHKASYVMGHFSDEFIRSLFNLCDIYVAPSRHEGFGLPHIEAMACQKPVITCRGTAAEETSLNGETGYVVSSRPFKWKNAAGHTVEGVRANTEELKEAIKKLIMNKELREKMGKNARKHMLENYESKKIAEMFVEKLNL